MSAEVKPKILVVDDEQPILNALSRALRRSFDVLLSLNGQSALEILRSQEVAVILSDQRMPEMSGVEFFKKASGIQPDAVRIMLTGYSDIQAVVEAVNSGQIFYYLQKPWEPETLSLILQRGVEKYGIIQENRRLTRELDEANRRLQDENIVLRQEVEKQYTFDSIIGQSSAMEKVFSLLKKVIPTDTTVLITGETGTGKELVAQAIHYNGPRKEKLFVAQNCAALPDTLLESILFGHKKGAFTDAISDRKGLFEVGDGGTVFLDEIADTSTAFQQRLLRVLQEREITPIGSHRSIKVDVRVISSSNRDLGQAVQEGRFREDLFYRLNVFPVFLPSLTERREDIPMLARHFIDKCAHRQGKEIVGISREAELLLMKKSYPGNIRELENIIERAVVVAEAGESIGSELLDLGPITKSAISHPEAVGETKGTLKAATAELESQYIKEALSRYGYNISRAARELGLSRAGLYRKMERLKFQK